MDYPGQIFEAQEQAIALKRLKLLEAAKRASQDVVAPQGQMVSGRYVAPSWSQHLNAALQPSLAHYQEQQEQEALNTLQENLSRSDKAARAAWLQGQPQSRTVETPVADGETGPGVPQTVRPTQQQNLAWLDQGRGIPSLRGTIEKAFADQLINEPEREEQRQFRREESQANRDLRREQFAEQAKARFEELKLRLEDRNLDRQSREQMAREMRQLQATIASQGNATRYELGKEANDIRRQQVEAAAKQAEARGSKLSDKARAELDELDATEQGIATAIADLKSSSAQGTGWGYGVVQNAVPGGSAVVAGRRTKETNDAIQQLTYFTDAIRHDRFGTALTKTEKAAAAQYLPNEYDSKDELVRKAEGLQKLIQLNHSRLRGSSGGATGSWALPPTSSTGGATGSTAMRPTPGAIEGGYRYRGGDPSQRSSWEKLP